MSKGLIILIAEGNPQINNLIKNELAPESNFVFTAKDMGQLKSWIYLRRAPDIIVLDLELPGLEKQDILELLDFYPQTPVILHCLPGNEWLNVNSGEQLIPVLKDGNSIAFIMQRIHQMCGDDLSVEMIDL